MTPDVFCGREVDGRGLAGRVGWRRWCARWRGSAQADKKKKDGLFDIQWWKPPVKHEHDAAQQLAPKGLNLTPGVAPAGEARTHPPPHLRRSRLPRRRSSAGSRRRAPRSSASTPSSEPVFNVRFEVESLRDWDRSHVGVPLGQPFFEELEALDDGKQVDLVVALVTPLHGVAASVHSIGYANYLSRHFVLRGMDDEQEFRAFEQEFKLISAEERQRLYADRKAHKEVVCFLHEWGHTLGLIHHEDRNTIMNPAYDPQQTEFSDYDKRILEVVIARRLGARDVPNPESADLVPLFAAMPASEGSEAERALVLDLVKRRAAYAARPVPRQRRRSAGRRHHGVQQGGRDVRRRSGRRRVEGAGAGRRPRARAQGRRRRPGCGSRISRRRSAR